MVLMFYVFEKIKDERYIDAIGALVTIVDANPMVGLLKLTCSVLSSRCFLMSV